MNLPEEVRKSVAQSYARAVDQPSPGKSSCCCGPTRKGVTALLAGYTRELLTTLPADAVQNAFGCGNPIALAEIRQGDTVLDLGSGAGIDVLLAAKLTGPSGQVIGIDMTPTMIHRARANAEAADLTNIEIRQGIIENLPVESNSIDLILSNCVINLSPEKPRVFAEMFRVLRAGGRFVISDVVAEPLPSWIKELSQLYSACIAGAIPETDYLAGLRAAGLVDVAVRDRLVYGRSELSALIDSELAGSSCCGSAGLSAETIAKAVEALAGTVASIQITGRKK